MCQYFWPTPTDLVFGVAMATQVADELFAFHIFDHHQVNVAIIEVLEFAEALWGYLTVARNGENTDIHKVSL